MSKSRPIKLLAYLFVPVIFGVIGYGLLKVALKPVWELTSGIATMMIADDAPSFNKELESIYDPNSPKYVDTIVDDTQILPEAKVVIPISAIDFPKSGVQYANLSCERISLDSPVYWNDTNEILRYGAGQYIGSFPPGFGRLILLCAHNTTYFAPLEYIEVGDKIEYDTNYDKYEYEVVRVDVINENDLEAELQQMFGAEEETLVMYTCYPFYAISGRKTDRLTVFAKRVSGLDVQWVVSDDVTQ